MDAAQIGPAVARARRLGATAGVDGLADPKMNGIVLAAPGGHEFQRCNRH